MGAPPTPRFMPVMLAPPSSPEPASAPLRTSNIEIVLDGGRTVRVATDVDTTALLRIVEALETSR